MFIESIKKSNKAHIRTEATLDVGLIKEITRADSNVVAIQYTAEEMGNPLNLPFQVSNATIYIRTTDLDIYAGVVVEFADDNDYADFCEYADGCLVEFDAYFNDSEKIKLLSTIVNRLK